ncbi:hypothetical protein, partial [Maioricimonas sp. JC845]|uniref:hypothetical protein n=1 Tax=Maioricimonas sp. JC845 TaxID=3232138 RepID=UPI003458D408
MTISGGGLFAGAVTGVGALIADTLDADGIVTAASVSVTGTAELGGDVTTTGQQEYAGAVTLTEAVVLTGVDTDMNGAGVEFSSTVAGGGNDLEVSGGGLFASAVSGVEAFTADSLETQSTLSAGSVSVTGAARIGDDVTTTAQQEFGGAVTLTGNVQFTGVDTDADGEGVE